MSNDALHSLIDERKSLPGALLPILHAIQDHLGYVPDEAVPLIAKALNQSRAEIHGVISYYSHFRQRPPGRHVLQICRAEACQAVGAQALIEEAQSALGCDFHETSADGAVTLEPVFCLGHCAVGPNIQHDDKMQARVSIDDLRQLLARMRGLS